jgi:hypothetical protein
MRLVPTRRAWPPLAAGVVAALLPVAAVAARSAPGLPTVARAAKRPAGDVVDRSKARRVKAPRAAAKPHRR